MDASFDPLGSVHLRFEDQSSHLLGDFVLIFWIEQEGCAAGVVIPVGVADEQDARVGESEAELLNAFAD